MVLHIFNRDQWKGYVAPYHPVFLDGWSPEYPVTDEREHMSSPIGAGGTAAVATEGGRTRAEDVSVIFMYRGRLKLCLNSLSTLKTGFYCILSVPWKWVCFSKKDKTLLLVNCTTEISISLLRHCFKAL